MRTMKLLSTGFAVMLLCTSCMAFRILTLDVEGAKEEAAKIKANKAEKETREKEWKENGEASVRRLISSGGVLSGDGKYVFFQTIDRGVDGTGSRPVLNIVNTATGETKEGKIRVSGNVSYDILSAKFLSPATATPAMYTGPAGTDTVLMGYRKTEYVGSYTISVNMKTAYVSHIVLAEGYRLYSGKSGWTGTEFDAPVAPVIVVDGSRELLAKSYGEDVAKKYTNPTTGRRWDSFSQFHPRSAAFSPDGKSFAVYLGNYSDEDDFTLEQKAYLYNRSSSKSIRTFKIDLGEIIGVRFSPDSKQLYVQAYDREAKVSDWNIFDVATGKLLDIVDEI